MYLFIYLFIYSLYRHLFRAQARKQMAQDALGAWLEVSDVSSG